MVLMFGRLSVVVSGYADVTDCVELSSNVTVKCPTQLGIAGPVSASAFRVAVPVVVTMYDVTDPSSACDPNTKTPTAGAPVAPTVTSSMVPAVIAAVFTYLLNAAVAVKLVPNEIGPTLNPVFAPFCLTHALVEYVALENTRLWPTAAKDDAVMTCDQASFDPSGDVPDAAVAVAPGFMVQLVV